jgi:hypothetical protein
LSFSHPFIFAEAPAAGNRIPPKPRFGGIFRFKGRRLPISRCLSMSIIIKLSAERKIFLQKTNSPAQAVRSAPDFAAAEKFQKVLYILGNSYILYI